jgi:hypothetical protein
MESKPERILARMLNRAQLYQLRNAIRRNHEVIGQRPPINDRLIPRFIKRHPLFRIVVVSRIIVRVGFHSLLHLVFVNRLDSHK